VKLVLFQASSGGEVLPGLLTDRGAVDISGAVKKEHTPQLTMQGIIDGYDGLKPALEKLKRALALPTIAVSATDGDGIDELWRRIANAIG